MRELGHKPLTGLTPDRFLTYNRFRMIGEIDELVNTLDEYEATIALAYIKRLIKSRTKENRD
jgi:hypothetical protein